MGPKRLEKFLENNFGDKGLIIVSNREPYIHKKTASGVKIESPAGGLTSAMDDVLKATGGTWIAWGSGSADSDVVDKNGCVDVPPGDASYKLKRVWLTKSLVDNYYHGYSNQVLWPLCHMALNRVYFQRSFWEGYVKANFLFAHALLEEVEDDSVVWIHDYHLCIVPKLLKEKKPSLTISHFWHIPWPDWSVFRVCPRGAQIIEGLLGNDLIGFQLPLFARNFIDCVKETLDAEVDYDELTITYREHTTRLKAFPISIDYEKFDEMSLSRRSEHSIKKIKSKYNLPVHTGIGVDRLEYTKGLIKRLQALNLFFRKYEKFRGKFTFVQIAVPTRMKEPYISYKRAVEELINKINGRYSTDGWKPVVYIDSKIDHKDLVAYYRMADIGIISSIYDGMNLVAKEFVASQVDEKGVLIISGLAGAADELEGAIVVNPYDAENFSDSISIALRMNADEKTNRMKTLRKQVRDFDIYRWILNIFYEIASISSIHLDRCLYFFENREAVRNIIKDGAGFLFLDYDGTLTPIVDSPEEAFISDGVYAVVKALKSRFPVAVITGRALKDIMERVGIGDIVYAGNHGAEIWDGKEIVYSQGSSENRSLLKEFLERLRQKVSHIQGVLIEDKGITASIHFRKVWTKHLGELFTIFWDIAKDYEKALRITSGKKVFEIRPVDTWNKGDAVQWILENLGGNRKGVYIGDDTTDEDAYRVLKGKGVSISVGGSPEADFYLKNQEEVVVFLQWLASTS